MQGRLENEIKMQNSIQNLIKDLPEVVNEWYINMKASRKTATSCYDYISKVKNFLEYISYNESETGLKCITLQSCESYMIMNQTKVSNNGMIIYTSDSYQLGIWYALNNFLSFLKKMNYIEDNYMNYIGKPQNRDLQRIKDERVLLTQKDFNKILKSVEKCNYTRTKVPLKNRDMAILLIFMTTGIRKTALSELNLSDYDRDKQTLRVVDKGNVFHYFPLNEMASEYLHKWLVDRVKYSIKNPDALFLNYAGERITQRGIVKIVERYSEDALGYKISPHKLRAGFCSILYDQTKNIEFVRRAVGHSCVSTTQRYIKTVQDEKEIASNMMSKFLDI